MTAVTGTMVRDLLLCERRAHLDVHGDGSRRDEVSSFVRMLWDGGLAHEDAVVAALPGRVVDLRDGPAASRAEATRAALDHECDWIVGGRLEHGDRVGVPDLLHRVHGAWHAGDAKSGSALEPSGRPNAAYAVQVGHYASMLGDLELGAADRAFVIGRHGGLTWYDLLAPRGARPPIADEVARLTGHARLVIAGTVRTRAALASACALCHWRSICRAELEEARDVTLVAGLGRSLREVVETVAPSVDALAALDLDGVRGENMPGLGWGRLVRFRDRARLLATPGATAFARAPLEIARHGRELHLDLETDPLSDGFVYLHGVLEVTAAGEHYHAFFAEGLEDERRAFEAAWRFLDAEPRGHVYHYSRFERTSYRVLAKRYPDVCSGEEVEELFSSARSTDLLVDVVQPLTEWPTNGVGIKALAKSLGFAWRDADASGAASIAWFHDWCDGGDPEVRRRILDYNEDDCRATAVLLDALEHLPVLTEAPWPTTAGIRR
jgi:predicted RecB family nuclease